MNLMRTFTLWLCGMIIRLYPRQFREQFGAEMQTVSRTRLDAAVQDGHVVSVCLHEIFGALKGLIHEYAAVLKAPSDMQPSGAEFLWLGLVGVALMFRRGIVSYGCDLANATGGGFANQVVCYVYRQDPGGRFLGAIAIIMVMPLVGSILWDVVRLERWNVKRILRFTCYALVGGICGVIGQLSPRWTRWVPLPDVLTLLLYVAGVWLLPVLVAMMIEMRRKHHRATLALTTIIVWVSAVQTYYLCYAALIAFGVAGAQLETLQVIGTGTQNWDNFKAFFHFGVRNLMVERGAIAIVLGAIFGTIVGLFGTRLSRSQHNHQHIGTVIAK